MTINDLRADTILTNANVYTVDKNKNSAEAIAIKDGKIIFIGSDSEIMNYKGDKTTVYDLEKKLVLPSFIDSHMHPAVSAIDYLFRIQLRGVFTREDYLVRVKEFVEKNPNLEEYEGSGFQRSAFGEYGPIKEDLDKIMPNKPMSLSSVDGHSLWVNSKTLELAGITKDTPSPAGGVIKKDPETGEPTGLLTESARNAVKELFTPPTKEQYKESILWLQKWFNSLGLTSCHDAIVEFEPDYYMAYEELAREGKLTIRFRGSWLITPEIVGGGEGQSDDFIPEMTIDEAIAHAVEVSKTFQTPYWQINSFKFFSDQVIEEETGFMKEAYKHRDDNWHGIKVWKDDFLREAFQKCDAVGFNIHTHQIGDAAADYALTALEYAVDKNGKRDSRHTFAHIQVIEDSDVARMKKLGMTAVIAPYWTEIDDYYWELYYPFLGEKLAHDGQYRGASLFEAGINTSFHSDFSVTEPDYGWALYTAVTRTQPEKIFKEEQGDKASTNLRTTDFSVKLKNGEIGPLGTKEECLT
ncbi:MAG: amidohydrolase, partial [Spirochaetales bacterium]|nr:amidohydrolase [Spirochaetales bacterium]